jgi:hypothetical protein
LIFSLALDIRPADRSFKGGWPGARVGQIEDAFSYHLQDANITDKKVVNYIPNVADNISYHAANFGENAINTTAARRKIRSVEILLDDP